MPKELERKLKATAQERGYSEERAGAFVYGTLRSKTGWKPRHQIKASEKKGRVL